MKIKEAKEITGSLTRTSKMPGLSYSLPAWECKTGAKLGQESERASKQAREREGGPTGSERTKVTSGSRADKR